MPSPDRVRREWLMVGVGLALLLGVLAIVVSAIGIATDRGGSSSRSPAATAPRAAAPVASPAQDAPAPTLADARGIGFEKFHRVDPTLPPVPAGAVKTFRVDVYQHVTQVASGLAPTEVWSFAVNGVRHSGTGVSAPMVVREGDLVDFTLTNGSTKAMNVSLPHSLDFHSAEVNPGSHYGDLAPGKSMHYRFRAKHPGVFMYHCATQPVLMHTGAGMVGMFVVKPKQLPAVDKELWVTQQEYYIGKPGGVADMSKMQAKKPDVIAFNGFANQYKDHPISVRKGERVRLYVLNAGPSIWSAFHVIGTVFDRTTIEGQRGHDAQTVNLAPSQGGWVEFTLDQEGTYPFVTHGFGDMVKGALGMFATPNAPAGAGHGAGPAAAQATTAPSTALADVSVTLGDMWVKTDVPSYQAGKISFAVTNNGATVHGMGVSRVPVKQSGGTLDKAALIGIGKDLQPGQAETISVTLKPGHYELICHIPGHFAAGQRLRFDVTAGNG